ncbi:galectin-9-like [Eleutherodactylus coqui]|uniref:galectin-9-like n=1 Tax=Eleutherodactylus coqui TaxID=57060 RepID=UPI0034621F58
MAAISFGPIFNPPVPFSTHLNHGFTNGTLVMIGGSVPLSADRFDLNFKCGPAENDDIAFHFNPHFDEGLVVCNTMERNKWGKEEHKHELPFRKGHPFELWILITYHDYKVSVNRRHFLQYRHRIPVHRVNTLTVTGCISLTSIEILAQGVSEIVPL